jgi:hypothetical protein
MVFERSGFKEPKKNKGMQAISDYQLVKLAKSGNSKKKGRAIDEIARRLRAGRRVRGINGLQIPGFHDRRIMVGDYFKKAGKLRKMSKQDDTQNGS